MLYVAHLHCQVSPCLHECCSVLRKGFRTGLAVLFRPYTTFPVIQYVEAISSRQSELDSHIAEGYKNALTEERRRYCFLVDRQCALAKSTNTYHTKVRIV